MTTPASRGVIIWLTGLSGAGKSTLSRAVRDAIGATHAVEVLDGDEIRAYLSKDLGFSREDRETNIRRIGFVARLLARHGVIAIAAAISPYAATRTEVRTLAEAEGIAFIEVFVSASLDSLVDRDVKGLYKRALAGEVRNFTGISDPYEPPLAPEVTVYTDRELIKESTAKILKSLAAWEVAIQLESLDRRRDPLLSGAPSPQRRDAPHQPEGELVWRGDVAPRNSAAGEDRAG
jgi:adenylylsulfate kinase